LPPQVRERLTVEEPGGEPRVPARFGPLRYEGNYRGGLRDGLWRVTQADDGTPRWETTWLLGDWHGRSTEWYGVGRKKEEGEHVHGARSGVWSHWFENGQLAAVGRYEEDRKVGEWHYWDEKGDPVEYTEWQARYDQWDWAFDDYTGTPRGENWPDPPAVSPAPDATTA
jgi:antitoxin component YwqK of YwqJK toxin-antitoxin module